VRIENPTRAGAAQAAVLAGLMPARPARSFANLGEAYATLCEAAGARLAAMGPQQREERYLGLSELLLRGVNGPAACLAPVALDEAGAKQKAGQPLGTALTYLMQRLSEERQVGSSFALDYERGRQWRKRATEVLIEEERRGAGGD